MTRSARLTLAGIALLGLVVGIVAAMNRKETSEEAKSREKFGAAEALPSDFARIQFHYADLNHARKAVEFEIYVLQQLKRVEPKSSIPTAKLGLAYSRLAMIEEADGRNAEAKAAFNQARVFVKKASANEEITDEQLRSAIRMLDSALEKTKVSPL